MTSKEQMPIRYPKTAVLRVRTDMRALAGIALYFETLGVLPESRNSLGGQAMVAFYQTLVKAGMIEKIDNTEDAAVVLERLGFSNVVTEGMSRPDYGVQVTKEDLIDSGDSAESGKLAAIIKESLVKARQDKEQGSVA